MSDEDDRLGDVLYGLFPDDDADSVEEIREIRDVGYEKGMTDDPYHQRSGSGWHCKIHDEIFSPDEIETNDGFCPWCGRLVGPETETGDDDD